MRDLKRDFIDESDDDAGDGIRDKARKKRKLKVINPTAIEQENKRQIKINASMHILNAIKKNPRVIDIIKKPAENYNMKVRVPNKRVRQMINHSCGMDVAEVSSPLRAVKMAGRMSMKPIWSFHLRRTDEEDGEA